MAVTTIYDYPHYYDILFGWDRSVEASFYHRTFGRCGVSSSERVLEVASGTGQVALLLARLGYRVSGLDVSIDMLEYMRRAAEPAGVEVDALYGDMTDFSSPHAFAAAYNPMSSFRLLHDDVAARQHLVRVAACLRMNGVYVLDMAFEANLVESSPTTLESWEMARGRVVVRAENDAIYVNDHGVERVLAWGTEVHLHPYTIESFVQLLQQVRGLRLESWHPVLRRATGVSEFALAPTEPTSAGRTMLVLRRVDDRDLQERLRS